MDDTYEVFYMPEDVTNSTIEYFGGDELAASTAVTKYLLRKIYNDGPKYLEKTPDDMHDRLAREFHRIETKYPNPLSYDEIRQSIDRFRFIVPQGSVMYGVGNPYANVSLSNCVVVSSPKDSMSGIFDTAKDMANLYKRRCGVGVDISSLRPAGAPVKNSAGSSTGAASFADFYSYVCRMVGQSGRRGASMQTMSVYHPDIEAFVTMKRDLTLVTGSNISVMITDEFMKAVVEDTDFVLRWPCDLPPEKAKFTKVISARELWDTINESARLCAEPGVIFIDNYKRNLPAECYEMFKSVCVNPCSEVLLSALDSCRLLSENLKNYVVNPFTEQAYFDFELFKKYVRIGQRLMDDIVDLEIECIDKIISIIDDEDEKSLWSNMKEQAVYGRRTGHGTHGLADVFSRMRIRYDSDEAVELSGKIYKALRDAAYSESVNMAKERGAFKVFDWNKEKDCEFIKRLPDDIKENIRLYGRRNISILTNAPTGSVSILSQTSSGIEPVFSNFYIRRKKINPSDTHARVDYIDTMGDKWSEYLVFHHNVLDYIKSNKELSSKWRDYSLTHRSSEWEEWLKNNLPDYFVTAPEVEPEKRVLIQGVIQSYIDHGISSTINLPKNTTTEQIQSIYMNAWKNGLKGVTVYVDGSRSGVLVSASEKQENDIHESVAPKRPKVLPCDIHRSQIDGQDWTILVGILNDKPYEIFGGLSEHIVLPRRYKNGLIIKGKRDPNTMLSSYDLVINDGDDDDRLVVKDIVSSFKNEAYATHTRMLSMSLRHGIPIQFIVEQIGKDQNTGFHSFFKVIARVLKKYIKDGTKSADRCMSCGEKLIFTDGCFQCPNCGFSKCN